MLRVLLAVIGAMVIFGGVPTMAVADEWPLGGEAQANEKVEYRAYANWGWEAQSWYGPKRDTYAKAKADLDAYKKETGRSGMVIDSNSIFWVDDDDEE